MSFPTVPCFALTTSGLEKVSASEIAALPCVCIKDISYRRIDFDYSGPLAALLSLRTVDDVFLKVATWENIGRPRSSLERLGILAASLDLRRVACTLPGHIGSRPAFSVTASFVGKRNYTSEEIKTRLAHAIAEQHRWTYQQDDRVADLNVRVFLEHEVAVVGVRLGKTALHDRWYQHAHLPGALKPSLAAALLRLAQVTPALSVLDPCCGSGTILIEAALQGAVACGGDSNPLALAAARCNASAAGVEVSVRDWDARTLPLAAASIDRVICNLPWGRQVAVTGGDQAALYRRIIAEMRRVLAPAGRIVLLVEAPEQIDMHGLRLVERLEISLFGRRPTILILATRPE